MSVWIRLSIFSQLSIIQSIVQYKWGCVFSVYPLPLWWLREYIYILSYYHHQIGSMNYCPLFRVRSWNNGVHCMFSIFLMVPLMALSHDNLSWFWSRSISAYGVTRPQWVNMKASTLCWALLAVYRRQWKFKPPSQLIWLTLLGIETLHENPKGVLQGERLSHK